MKLLKRFLLICILLVLIIEAFLFAWPNPILKPTVIASTLPSATQPNLPWPDFGQEALGAEGYGVLTTHGQQQPAPIASVAKIMTTYCVLKEKPLAPGQQGPTITISSQDFNTYNDYYLKGGSVARVQVGEKISEYQALQAMLLPSANNFADTLADWAFGSMDRYITFATEQAKDLGLTNTHIAGASGFLPQTMSSAQDVVILGETVLQNPVVAQIVSQPQATIPVAGTVHNVNWLLGVDNINGIKTGNTDQAGGCYLYSSKRQIDGHDITLIGAIVGAPTLNQAISSALPIIKASDQYFKTVTVVKAGQVVGNYSLPWGGQVPAVAKQDLQLFVWQGQKITINTKLRNLQSPKPQDTVAGNITANTTSYSVAANAVLSQKIPAPPWKWKIFGR